MFSGRGGHLGLHPHRVSPRSDSSRPLKSTKNLPELWSTISLERSPYLPLLRPVDGEASRSDTTVLVLACFDSPRDMVSLSSTPVPMPSMRRSWVQAVDGHDSHDKCSSEKPRANDRPTGSFPGSLPTISSIPDPESWDAEQLGAEPFYQTPGGTPASEHQELPEQLDAEPVYQVGDHPVGDYPVLHSPRDLQSGFPSTGPATTNRHRLHRVNKKACGRRPDVDPRSIAERKAAALEASSGASAREDSDCSGSSGRCRTPKSSWDDWREPILSCPDETLFEHGAQEVSLPPPATDSLMTAACWTARGVPLLEELAQEAPHGSASERHRIIRAPLEESEEECSPDFDWDHRNCIVTISGHSEADAHDILFDVPDAELLSAPPATPVGPILPAAPAGQA